LLHLQDDDIGKQYKKVQTSKESFEQPTLITACLTYLGFYLLMIIGYINQLFFVPKVATEKNRDDYVPLFDSFERFYLRYVYRRVKDCWNRPICSCPADTVTLKDRVTKDFGWTFEFTGTQTTCLNLGSYNYLGFAQNKGPCAEDSIEAIHKYGIATYNSRRELGKEITIILV
jgi:serine palmitoyltransferase